MRDLPAQSPALHPTYAPGRLPAILLAPVCLLCLVTAGCSLQKVVVTTMEPVIRNSLAEAYSSADVQMAREAIPGQLMLLRGLCRSDSTKISLWTSTVQLYAAYALLFVEPNDPDRAAILYEEGKDLALSFLMRKNWFRTAWQEGPDALRAAIRKREPHDLAPLMTWASVCLGKHVLFNLDRPRELADLPFAYVLADAAIELDAEYFYGMPLVLKGVMLAATPPMLGGDVEEAERLFQDAYDVSGGQFLYYKVLHAGYVSVAALDEERFEQDLREVMEAPDDLLPEARLLNRLAKEDAAKLLDRQWDLF